MKAHEHLLDGCVISFLAGEALGVIGMAILSGWLDKQMNKKQKRPLMGKISDRRERG